MKQIYKSYFQKSKVFLYPLLNIPKGINFVPTQTHISYLNSVVNYHKETYKFFCLYHIPCEVENKEEFDEWRLFKQAFIDPHNLYEEEFWIDSRLRLYMFDFSNFKKDINMFIKGKYSKFSKYSKDIIVDFFGDTGNISKYVNSYLYPKDYYEIYAELLNVPVELLEQTGELCDIPDMEKENFDKKCLQFELFK